MKWCIIALALAAHPAAALAQSSSPNSTYLFLDESPTASQRLSSVRASQDAPAFFWRGLPADAMSRRDRRTKKGKMSLLIEPMGVRWEANSGYPSDRNNGSLWAGRG